MDQNFIDSGNLQINVTGQDNRPIRNATVSISYTGEPGSTIEQGNTDSSGQLVERGLKTPPIEWSLDQNNINQPYAEYTLNVVADGYEPFNVSGVELLADTTSVQNVSMIPAEQGEKGSNVVIPAHTLYGEYPEKIPESEVKPVNETGEIVLSRVVVPEYVIVHDGTPSDSTANDYYVTYRDYIKNVASSEIYATWPEETIIANVLAIMSFTLNRVYTEW